MEVGHNIVVGTTAAAIQLRGVPTSYDPDTNTGGMYVHDNVFGGCKNCALTQTREGLVEGPGNVFDQASVLQQLFTYSSLPGPTCDFDGDGSGDQFRNVAGDFYYHSSELGRWVYMTTLNATGSLSLGDVNSDGRCDVYNAQGTTYLMPPAFETFSLPATVPNLYGMTEGAAVDAVAASGLALDTVAHVASLDPAGTVIGQSRTPGSTPQAGSLVALTVSVGGVALPNVVGMSEWVARNAITWAGLPVGSVSYNMYPAPVGSVYAQSPATSGSGTTIVAPGTTVSFSVSLGQTTVPNIMSWDTASADRAITGAGLVVGRPSTVNNCIAPGTVQVQNPYGGVQVTPGTTVSYTVSTCTGGGGGGNPREP
jgi:beta-lactam-binding protein with PASTA domain